MQNLVAAIEADRVLSAAVMRTLLAFRMPRIAAVHHRLLYGSENVLWDQVADVMGSEWRRMHHASLSIDGESLHESCVAALDLYRLVFEAVQRLPDIRQMAVATHALTAISVDS